MSDEVPVSVVIDCSVPDRAAVEAYTQDQVEAVLKQRAKGDITSAQAAERLVALADLAADAVGIPDRVTIVPLEGDDLADHEARLELAAEEAAEQTKAQAEKDTLVAKLADGAASTGEVQAALATLLGGDSPTAS